MLKKFLKLSFVIFCICFYSSSWSANIAGSEAEEEEAEVVASSTQEQIIQFENLPEKLRDEMPSLLPYLPETGNDKFFFTQAGNKFHLYKDDAAKGQSVRIGTFEYGSLKIGISTSRQNGLFLTQYNSIQNKPIDTSFAAKYLDYSPKTESSTKMASSPKSPAKSEPTYKEVMTGVPTSHDHAVQMLKNGWVSETVVALPVQGNIGINPLPMSNAPLELQEKFFYQTNEFDETLKAIPYSQLRFSYHVDKNEAIWDGNPPSFRVYGPTGLLVDIPIPKDFYQKYTGKGEAYVPSTKQYFFKMGGAASSDIAYRAPASDELNKFIETNEEIFYKMQSSGIMPKEWETKKFKIDYIDTKGRLVSKELNPKEISDLVFGSAAKKSSELVVENEGYKSYTSKLKDPKFPLESLNLDNPNLAIDPQFNNQTFKIEYYDASGQKHLEPMKLSEVYALLSGDGKLADRPKFDNRDQYLREIAKEVRKQDLGLVYKIYDPDTKANIYSFGDNFESSKDLIHVILNDKDARKFYKYMEDPNHKWSEEKKFQILTESKVSPKLKTKANSSKHNLVVISRPHLPSKSLAKRTQYNFKPRQANNPRLGTTKLLSASYTYSTQSTLSQANEELVG